MKELIQDLVQIAGPSGYEADVREYVQKDLKGHVDEMKVDPLGNLITRKGPKDGSGLNVMLAAHLDEIGVIVTHLDDNGFARFTTVGGVFPRNTVGARVKFLNGTGGVIGMEPTGYSSVTPINQMYIDVGVTKKSEMPVKVGDVAAFERTFEDLGKRLVSKALDDRVGVAVLIEIMKQLKDTPHNVFGVFTVQEEVGVRGAAAAAYGVDPDLGIAIDVTLTGDTPKAKTMDVSLGKGPAIKVKDSGMISDPRVVAWMEAGAKRARIPYQKEILTGGSTDARAIQITREGVPAGCVSIPCRYVHSPSEMVDYKDVQDSVKLLVQLLKRPIKL
ncbi:MAG: M42 family peptidase [Chloroflexi bacterium]|nr:MAG: M42 family peptidase [Chloroflexota bacterium]MBL1193309.1 M42 family peptidase [Chloroflexota bacterium]NOH10601.1 M42 family metallopeptidase [Chloroflexota bacterium]